MEPTAKVALGSGVISMLAAGGMLAAGVLATSAVGVLADPVAPPAAAAGGLQAFDDCADLRRWYVAEGLRQVGPWGWEGRVWRTTMRGTTDALSAAESAPSDEVANGATGTNTQEAGVDEPDVAKTDGRIVVQLLDGRRVVVTDVTGDEPRRLSQWRMPRGQYADGLLLVGDHVLVTGASMLPMEGDAVLERSSMPTPVEDATHLYDLDVSDPTTPRLDGHSTWSGRLVSLRQYDETVRLVTSTGLPELPFVQPRPGVRSEAEAERANRQVVRESRIEDWLPGLDTGTSSGPLVDCADVHHPALPARRDTGTATTETLAISTFRPGSVGAARAVAVTGAGSEVYSSEDRLYVTATDWGTPLRSGPDTPTSSDSLVAPMSRPRTEVHAFALEPDSTRYVASGAVDGTVRDRWSLDERDGFLRVAVSWPNRQGGTQESGIVVLDERGSDLVEVGGLRGLGVDEDIQSVRWFDDLAVVVTFRQVDPLYTIDLADPVRPRRLGELKIPGFSSYLHPIGDDRLLGLGTDATLEGQSRGAQAAVFDLTNPAAARRVDKVGFGEQSWLSAADDPHAFTWVPEADTAVTTVQRWDTGDDPATLLLRVADDGSIGTREVTGAGGWEQRALPLGDGRIALAGERVRLLDLTAD